MSRIRTLALLLPLALVFVSPDPGTAAQTVRGKVVDPLTAHGVADVKVAALLGAKTVATTFTGADGDFELRVRQGGRYALELSRLGYAPSREYFDVPNKGEIEVLIRLRTRPVEVDEIEVAESPRISPVRFDVEGRIAKNRQLGMGDFIEGDDLRYAAGVTSALRTLPYMRIRRTGGARGGQGVFMSRGGQACTPRVFVDGSEIRDINGRVYLDDLVRAGDVDTIEVYRGLSQGPGMYADMDGCGTVLVWTRRDAGEDARLSVPVWVNVSLIGLLLLLFL